MFSAGVTEVLSLVADGLSDREIATQLVVSPHTVHRHVATSAYARPRLAHRSGRRGGSPRPALTFDHPNGPSGQNGPRRRCGTPRARLIVVAMSTSHTYTQRYPQPVPADGRQTSADIGSAATEGARFSLRPLRVSDRDALRALFARLSPESRRRRFLTGKPELSDRELTYLTDVDHVRHEALTAIDPEHGSLVGVARYVIWPDRADAADVAIEVADDLQRNGIGLMLAEALIRRARENGVRVLTATTLWENHAARALARRVGFRARSSAGNDIELELHLDSARTGVAEEARGTRRR